MIRVQIQFTEDQLQSLRCHAAQEQVSVSALVRQAVGEWERNQAGSDDEAKRRRAIMAAGCFASGTRDGSARHDDYLAESYRA